MWEERLKIYKKIIELTLNVEFKGKTVPYTSANTYMFSQLNKDAEIGIRLPKESYKEFIEKYKATEFRSYGAVMREYVKIPDELLDDVELLSKYLAEAHEYVMSLPPKKSKKK